ncbi:hypothetical protein BH23GEM3_BH23GEM3_08790 [soil metagenome]
MRGNGYVVMVAKSVSMPQVNETTGNDTNPATPIPKAL